MLKKTTRAKFVCYRDAGDLLGRIRSVLYTLKYNSSPFGGVIALPEINGQEVVLRGRRGNTYERIPS